MFIFVVRRVPDPALFVFVIEARTEVTSARQDTKTAKRGLHMKLDDN